MTTGSNSSNLTQEELNALEDAGRATRLVASILDSIFVMALVIPAMWITGGFEGLSTGEAPTLLYSLGIGLFGYVVFIVLNGKLLLKNGQTLGKKLQNIKVVTLDDDAPRLFPHLVKRYALFFMVGYVPYIGGLLSMGNILLIFGKKRKCAHDYFAQTRVVKR